MAYGFVRKGAAISLAALAAVVWSGCGGEGNGRATTAASSEPLTADEVLPPGAVCTPTGAHGKHAFTSCTTCHACAGTLQFDPNGPAIIPGGPPPTFDATAKTCSSVKCHGTTSGTYAYWFPGGDGELAYNEVSYGGGTAAGTPSWYTTGGGGTCSGCHGNPPQNYTWHLGHPGGPACEMCHLDAVSAYDSTLGRQVATGLSTATNCGPTRNQPCASLHANGALNVDPKWASRCIGCH